MAARCVPQCQGPLMDAQIPSGMFVTPVYGWDEEISQWKYMGWHVSGFKLCAISGFGRIDGPSLPINPPPRQYFWPLGFHTAQIWSGQVSGFVIRYYINIIPRFDTL